MDCLVEPLDDYKGILMSIPSDIAIPRQQVYRCVAGGFYVLEVYRRGSQIASESLPFSSIYFLLRARSISTAIATVAPTIGLLPIPR